MKVCEMAEGSEVVELFLALRKHVAASKLEKVISTAEQILALQPDDAEALKTKVVALAKKSRFEEALAAAGDGAPLAAERAYCQHLYRRQGS